ncbi:unnamed protein product [Calypogeia fissa]
MAGRVAADYSRSRRCQRRPAPKHRERNRAGRDRSSSGLVPTTDDLLLFYRLVPIEGTGCLTDRLNFQQAPAAVMPVWPPGAGQPVERNGLLKIEPVSEALRQAERQSVRACMASSGLLRHVSAYVCVQSYMSRLWPTYGVGRTLYGIWLK